ncbi:uncharacterized protein VP01_7516g1 [Puccinia sorghi]|uniref:Uncharacterized protein n=1 Tax=Puccinia sorghi TaxID=27349 RepID=A0A0L6UC84_9BASI|nr:uncharacterized protein VP01_7516g1 [Puccinia sorghi]
MAGQQNPAPSPASNPQPFDGTLGAAAKAFFSQIGLHAITYLKRFPTDTSKVVFAVFFMKDYIATCLSRTWTRSSTVDQWSL